MKRIIGMAATMLLAATLAGQTPEKDTTEVMQHNNNFATSLLKTASSIVEEENFCISPASAMWALAMSANGADGKTAKEIYTALGYPAAYKSREAFNEMLHSGIEKMKGDNDKYQQMNIANSIWIDNKIDVKELFKSTSERYYNAAVRSVPLSTAAEEINGWCSKETNGRINNIIEHLPSTSLMAVVNAIWFKGQWVFPFMEKATSKQKFKKADGKTIDVDMMRGACFAPYYEDDFIQATARVFENSEYSMLFILPCEGVSTEAAIERLAQVCNSDFAGGKRYYFELEVPKFKIEFGANIASILKEMGIKRAFGKRADFSGISDTELSIDNVIQKNYISIDEVGVEAAGATSIMRCGFFPPPPEKEKHIRLDRPFIFAIRENSSGAILFAGRVGNPNQ